MNMQTTCPQCGTQLTGAIEKTTTSDGKYVFIVQRETSDCNWTQCTGCNQVLCKRCRRERPSYCCREGCIVDNERAQAAFAGNNSHKNTIQQEE